MDLNNELYFALVESQLEEGRGVKLTLRGRSMYPTLHEGDTLMLEPLAGKKPVLGDVYLFRCGGMHLLHRLIAIDENGCLFQGDNNYTTEHVRKEDVLARLVSVTRPGRVTIATHSSQWTAVCRRSLRRKRLKNNLVRWCGREGRARLRPWYFVALGILMWAPLNGLGIPLDTFVLGLRMDHLLHASILLPCALFLFDLAPRHLWVVWVAAVAVGLMTESVQYLLPYRGFDINDMIANTLGVTLGWMVMLVVRRRWNH